MKKKKTMLILRHNASQLDVHSCVRVLLLEPASCTKQGKYLQCVPAQCWSQSLIVIGKLFPFHNQQHASCQVKRFKVVFVQCGKQTKTGGCWSFNINGTDGIAWLELCFTRLNPPLWPCCPSKVRWMITSVSTDILFELQRLFSWSLCVFRQDQACLKCNDHSHRSTAI